jgi:hypothetical protein
MEEMNEVDITNEMWWDGLSMAGKREILSEASHFPLQKDRPMPTDIANGYHLCWKGLWPKTQRSVVLCRFKKKDEKKAEKEAV